MIRQSLATLALACTLVSVPAQAQDEIFALTKPVDIDQVNPDANEVGELIYRGGVEIEPGEEKIGGISSLEWNEEESRFYAVDDEGHWLTIEPDELDGRLIDVLDLARGELGDERGRRLRDKERADSEAITRAPDGGWLVTFEREHRVWRYADFDGAAEPATSAEAAAALDLVSTADPNGGLETFAYGSQTMIACGEWAEAGRANCVYGSMGGVTRFELAAPPPLAEHGGAPTDATCADDDTCYVLFRSYKPGEGNRAAIVELAPDAEPRVLATFLPPLTLDNFEGLAVREQFGKRYLYVISDNNFSDNQRTLLMKFEIKSDVQLVAATPEPEVNYATTDVVLVTDMGDITVRLETERAPVTTANFLRYVDEDRFDGTVFYRAMKLDREPQPNGLIQGGTQFDPERILPGIPHEPTTQTGLSHTNGALSMAMGDPGTANGDFSIMLGDQIGLDARPDAQEEIWRNGYAVFGYVIDGMDVVSAIHAAPADPNKGEGVMRGQMLADPVTIIDIRRVDPAE